MNKNSNIGIISYGVYIPYNRITTQEIAQANQQAYEKILASTGVCEKSVPSQDQDTITLSIHAAQGALERKTLDARAIGAVYVGSESHPYAVKPTATSVIQALGINPFCMAADLEFACKGGTAALQICMGLVGAGMVTYALAIGADTAQAAPGDILEYTAAAGSAAFIIGSDENKICARIDKTLSITTDTPDFWRRAGQPYPEHTGRFTANPGYFAHITQIAHKILQQADISITDIDFVVFHQPNARFPITIARTLGFTQEQYLPGLIAPSLGNTYSASTLLGLAAVLDQAKPNKKILVISYGSGSGCDAFLLTTLPEILTIQARGKKIKDYLANTNYISYTQYKNWAHHE